MRWLTNLFRRKGPDPLAVARARFAEAKAHYDAVKHDDRLVGAAWKAMSEAKHVVVALELAAARHAA